MSRFSAVVCDHCDARDIEGTPASHDILPVSTAIILDGVGGHFPNVSADLCKSCLDNLHSEIIRAMTQIPRQA